jgi:SP family myo-inositol transporter-like MFS transporter 13
MFDNNTMTSEEKIGGKLNDPKDLANGSVSEVNSLRDVLRDIDLGEINELAVVAEGEERTTWFVWILVICSTISGLLFGAWRRFRYYDPGSLGCRL